MPAQDKRDIEFAHARVNGFAGAQLASMRKFVPGTCEKGYGRIINIASLQSSRAFGDLLLGIRGAPKIVLRP